MIFLLSVFSRQPPVVIVHGIMENSVKMDSLTNTIKKNIQGIYVKSCEIGNGQESSIIMSAQNAINELSKCINDDPQLEHGFVGLGYSQGGLILRGYLQQYNHNKSKVLRFIGLSAPLGGFYCGQKSTCWKFGPLPESINKLFYQLAYTRLGQSAVCPAGYWRDPYQLDNYVKNCRVLPALDNIKVFNQQYKDNFMSVDKMILFGSANDGAISPWQSAWFEQWTENNDTRVVKMQDRQEYIDDTFGLRSMTEQGRLIRIDSGLDHFQYHQNVTWMEISLIKYIRMEL